MSIIRALQGFYSLLAPSAADFAAPGLVPSAVEYNTTNNVRLMDARLNVKGLFTQDVSDDISTIRLKRYHRFLPVEFTRRVSGDTIIDA